MRTKWRSDQPHNWNAFDGSGDLVLVVLARRLCCAYVLLFLTKTTIVLTKLNFVIFNEFRNAHS